MQKLTATAVRQAKAKAKVYKMWDGGSLYLLVKPTFGLAFNRRSLTALPVKR